MQHLYRSFSGEAMAGFFTLIFFLFLLIVIGTLFYLKKDHISHKEQQDAEYVCTVCDHKDCICRKQDPKT